LGQEKSYYSEVWFKGDSERFFLQLLLFYWQAHFFLEYIGSHYRVDHQ